MELNLREKAALLRVLGHPVRLAILMELTAGPKCVTDIQELLDVQQANVSQHLAALRHEKIVDYHEDGKLRCYYLARPGLVKSLLRFIGSDYPVVCQSKEAVRQAGRKRACAVKATPGKPRATNKECSR
jgi:ArsR family transcriptional regulator, arsenate/arsenite/antimonite-responsive transcriptional repressor